MFRSAPLVRSLSVVAAIATGPVTRSTATCHRLMPARLLSDSSSSSSGKNGSAAKPTAAAKPASASASGAVRPSVFAVDHAKDDQLVLEGTSTEIVSSPLATAAPTTAAAVPASLPHSADLSHFLQSLSTSAAASAKPTSAPSHRPIGPALPLFAPDHPLMTDDFGILPPFSSPTSLATTFGHLTISSADTEAHLAQDERRAMTRLIGHPSMPYILTPGNPMLPSGDLGRQKGAAELFAAEQQQDEIDPDLNDQEPGLVTMQVMSPPGTTSPATIMGLLPEGATFVSMRGMPERSEATKYWMTSVLRKRRKKMNKHKLRKLRKKTRSQRK